MARCRVRPEHRRKRLSDYGGLYYSQVAAILTLPTELRADVLKLAVREKWSCAQTIKMVAWTKGRVRYGPVERTEVRPRGMGLVDSDFDIWLPATADLVPCAHCSVRFRPTRADAKYHNQACRQAAYRARLAMAGRMT